MLVKKQKIQAGQLYHLVTVAALSCLTYSCSAPKNTSQSLFKNQAQSIEGSAPSNSSMMENLNSDLSTSSSEQCLLEQESGSTIVAGSSFYYSLILSEGLSSPEHTCDNGQSWWGTPYSRTQPHQFAPNVEAGNYNCYVRTKSIHGAYVVCQGRAQFAAIAAQAAPPSSVSQPVTPPAPVPAPSVPVVTTPTPTPTTPAVSSPSNYVLAPPDSQYTTDENLPDPFQAFLPLRQGQWAIGNSHVVAETGSVGARFPSSGWNIMGPNSKVRLAVLIPPGANVVGWGTEFNYFVQLLGSCGEGGRNCHDESSSPRLWPESAGNTYDPTFDPMKIPAITSPKVVYLTIKSTGKDAWLMSLNVNYQIKDPALYEAWRSQRRWAGGPGDCDGLGDIYASGPNCDLPGRR